MTGGAITPVRRPDAGLLGAPALKGQFNTAGLTHTVQGFRGAFIITPESLVDVERRLLAFAAAGPSNEQEPRVDVQVLSEREEARRHGGVQTALGERNPKMTPIYGLILTVKRGESQAQVQFDATGKGDWCGIRLFAASREQETVFTLSSEMRVEVDNVRDLLPSLLRQPIDSMLAWLIRNAAVIFRVLTALWLAFMIAVLVLAAIYRYTHPTQPESPASRVMERADPELTNSESLTNRSASPGPSSASASEAFDWPGLASVALEVTWIMVAVLLIASVPIMYGRLFPRVVFEIGEGRRRFERLSKWRWLIFGSIVTCGFFLPAVRSLVSSKIETYLHVDRELSGP